MSRFVWQGSTLFVPRNGSIPQGRCLVCVKEEGLSSDSREVTWIPPGNYLWIFFGLLAGVIPGLALMFLTRKRASLQIALCRRCSTSWAISGCIGCGYEALSYLVLPLLGYGLGQQIGRAWGGALGFLAGLALDFALHAWIHFKLVRPHRAVATYIGDDGVRLRLPRPDLVAKAWRMDRELSRLEESAGGKSAETGIEE